ncbi:MAG: hypothetical protein EOO92_20745 [Pedobacter sp.]|nr:MAG: hypothetical protein EOO92_20745 [Pedobacter sp.]
MSEKSMYQLIIPFATTILLFIAFYVIGFIIGNIGLIIGSKVMQNIAEAMGINIFEMKPLTVIFWIIDIIAIIYLEIAFSED